MTLPPLTTPDTARPTDADTLRAYAARLAEVDLWEQAAALYTSTLHQASPTAHRLETAWANFRAGNYPAASAVLNDLDPRESASCAGLVLALSALDGDVHAYHRLIADGAGPDADATGLRLALAAATVHADLSTAARVAKALLTHASADADAWSVIAAHKAAQDQMPSAIAATERARADRLDCQTDPAVTVLALLDRFGHPDAATALACHGAVAQDNARPGWVGWHGLLVDRVRPRLLLTSAPYTAVGAVTAGAAAVAVAVEQPSALVLHAALAAAAVLFVRTRTVDGLDAATTRLVRGALRRSGPTSWVRAALSARPNPFTAPTPPLDPNDCSCWESDLFSGPFWSAYRATHLRTDWVDEQTGLVAAHCPESRKQWIVLPDPGVAVVAPSGVAGPSGTGPSANSDAGDAVKTGQYL